MIEFDCETTGLQPWSQRQYAFLYIFMDDESAEAIPVNVKLVGTGGSPRSVLTWIDNAERIQHWFDKAKADEDGIRAWNAKFDRAFAEADGFDAPGDGRWHDGMVVAHAVNERRSVALKAVAKDLFGADAADPQTAVKTYLTQERKRRKKAAELAGVELVEPNFSDVPMSIMEPYALEDVILTRRIGDQYDPIVKQSPDIQHVVDFERPVMDALYAVEKRGLPASERDYRMLEQEVVQNLERLEDNVLELAMEGGAPEDFNPRSSAQIIEALKGRGADMSFMATKDGEIKSADAENLRAVDDELAAAILEFRSEMKVLSTYVRPMIGRHWESGMRMWKEPFIAPDGRIHANYRQVGARTGRMSCSDPNIQNQPRDDLRLRYCIAAEPGHKIVTCDLSNIEMVLFAAYCGDGRLLEAVRRGEDLHVLTAKMLGFRDRLRAGGVYESARQQGKTYNFSRIYGGGLRTIRKSFRCSTDEARRLKRRFDDAYPEVKRLTNRIEYRLHEQGYISDKMISGRRFRVEPREAYKGTNYLVQGTAAALLKASLVRLHQDGVPVVALVHDEIVAHVPEDKAEETRDLIIDRLTDHPKLTSMVPLNADGDICDHWSDAKPIKVKDNEGNETGETELFVPNWAKAAA